MAQDANHLVWLDMEMTGLEPDHDRIIEIAVIVTSPDLEGTRAYGAIKDEAAGLQALGQSRVFAHVGR